MSHLDYGQYLNSDEQLAKLQKCGAPLSLTALLCHLHVWLQFASEMRYVNAINI